MQIMLYYNVYIKSIKKMKYRYCDYQNTEIAFAFFQQRFNVRDFFFRFKVI